MSKRKNYIEKELALVASRLLIDKGRFQYRGAINWGETSTNELLQVWEVMMKRQLKYYRAWARAARECLALQTEEQLKNGNWSAAAAYLRKGGDISDEIRLALAEILEGKRRYPNRPPSVQTLRLHNNVAAFVVESVQGGMSAARAYRVASERFGLVPESVEDICKKLALTHVGWVYIEEAIRLEEEANDDIIKRIIEELERRGVSVPAPLLPREGGVNRALRPLMFTDDFSP